jgi:hypothetical protein
MTSERERSEQPEQLGEPEVFDSARLVERLVRSNILELDVAMERARAAEERARLVAMECKSFEHARSARFLLKTAVWLIPQSERARYLEEFRAEMLDIPHDTRRRPKRKVADAAARRARD